MNLKISLTGSEAEQIYLQTLITLPYLHTTSGLKTVTALQSEDYTAWHGINETVLTVLTVLYSSGPSTSSTRRAYIKTRQLSIPRCYKTQDCLQTPAH